MTTFALVHGAWHRASCWDLTAELLRDAGHHVVAVDLPCENPAAGLVDGAAIVLDALGDAADDDVVVVGHSLGGLTIPLVAAARPVREMVFLCAFVPQPGVALRDDLAGDASWFPDGWPSVAARQLSHEDGSSSWPPDVAVDVFYHDCPPDLAAWAAGELRRQTWSIADEPCPIAAWPDVPARAIVCAADRVLDAEVCARRAEERAGARVIRLEGGHSPMLAQPRVLVDALLAP